MKISPLVKLVGISGVAAGVIATAAVASLTGHHTAAPKQLVVRQDAATSSTSETPTVSAAFPKPTVTRSSVAVKKPAAVVQETTVTDPTTDETTPAPVVSTAPTVADDPNPVTVVTVTPDSEGRAGNAPPPPPAPVGPPVSVVTGTINHGETPAPSPSTPR